MAYESLSPNLLKDLLENRLLKLQQLLTEKRKAYEKAPPGRLRIAQRKGYPNYYQVRERGSLKGKYIPKKQLQLAANLAQKDYDQHYAAQWLKVQYQGLSFTPDAPEYQTALGERVRSKSEVIIADALSRHQIPNRYEYPLKLSKGQQTHIIYPDFLCLNIHTRREYIWEHFGMMDDPLSTWVIEIIIEGFLISA